MLSTTQLSRMQAVLTRSLPDVCSIDHVSKVSNGAGGTTETPVRSNDVPVRYAEVTDKREGFLEGDIIFGNPVWLFTFTAGTDVDVLDVITVNGRVYEVQIIFERSWQIDLRVICREKL